MTLDQKTHPSVFLKPASETFKLLVQLFKHLCEIFELSEKTESSVESLKSLVNSLQSLAACLYCSMVHAVPISRNNVVYLLQLKISVSLLHKNIRILKNNILSRPSSLMAFLNLYFSCYW